MKSNWEEITTEILSEHVGALAGIVIDDARAKCRTSPTTQPQAFLVEFVLRVVQELPDSVNRAGISAQLRSALK
jgi:hypothetical protein